MSFSLDLGHCEPCAKSRLYRERAQRCARVNRRPQLSNVHLTRSTSLGSPVSMQLFLPWTPQETLQRHTLEVCKYARCTMKSLRAALLRSMGKCGPMLWRMLMPISAVAVVALSQSDEIKPFQIFHVTLHQGSQFGKAFALNKEYMQSLDPERLLHTFRLNAGMNSTAKAFSGSWEDPTCEVRGQFMGHYLSGGAMLVNHTGDSSVLA